jgi:hypothetical protein
LRLAEWGEYCGRRGRRRPRVAPRIGVVKFVVILAIPQVDLNSKHYFCGEGKIICGSLERGPAPVVTSAGKGLYRQLVTQTENDETCRQLEQLVTVDGIKSIISLFQVV